MSDIEIRDDRQAGRLEALGSGGGEVVGHIQYFVLESPGRALVPVHTIVEPAHEERASRAPWPASSTPSPRAKALPSPLCARTSSSGPNATPTRPPRPTRNFCARPRTG